LVRFSAPVEDVAPKNDVVLKDLVELINQTYKFTNPATLPQNIPPQFIAPQFSFPPAFQNGELITEKEKIAIRQMRIMPGGAFVACATTESADIVLDSLIALLDGSFGYRIRAASPKRSRASNVVVQFERGVEDFIGALGRICKVISHEISQTDRADNGIQLKRLAFGRETGISLAEFSVQLPEAIEKLDFALERRLNQPFSENRYFSSAPMATQQLFRTLERIERELSKS
jgi:hypothetical protein